MADVAAWERQCVGHYIRRLADDGRWHDGKQEPPEPSWLMRASEILLTPEPFAVLVADINDWAGRTFPKQTPASKAKHLQKEAAELVSDPTDAEEMADIAILLLNLAAISGVDLLPAIRAKLEKNKLRTWGPPDADGVCEHIEPRGDSA